MPESNLLEPLLKKRKKKKRRSVASLMGNSGDDSPSSVELSAMFRNGARKKRPTSRVSTAGKKTRRQSAASLMARGDAVGAASAIGPGRILSDALIQVAVELMKDGHLSLIQKVVLGGGATFGPLGAAKILQAIPQGLIRDSLTAPDLPLCDDPFFSRHANAALAEFCAEAVAAKSSLAYGGGRSRSLIFDRVSGGNDVVVGIKATPPVGDCVVVLDSLEDCVGEANVESSSKSGRWVLKCSTPKMAEAVAESGMTVMRGANRMSYSRVLMAAATLSSPKKQGCSEELRRLLVFGNREDESATGRQRIADSASQDTISASKKEKQKTTLHGGKLGRIISEFNNSQSAAMSASLSQRLTLVQGPPGTGKTAVAVAVLARWALESRLYKTKGDDGMVKILATADSNVAVDNLLDGLKKANPTLKLVRLGRAGAVIRPDLAKYYLDETMSYEEKHAKLRKAEIVCATCIGAGSEMLERFEFTRVLVDEAAQIREGVTLVPLVRGANQLVLVGDQCQLPPTVLAEPSVAEKKRQDVIYDEPLFTRLLRAIPPRLLDTQYRMHPGLADFVKDAVYAGLLKSGVRGQNREFRGPLYASMQALANFDGDDIDVPYHRFGEEDVTNDDGAYPVLFHHVEGREQSSKGSASKYNDLEADVLSSLVEVVLGADPYLQPSDVAIIAPYAEQVKAISRRVQRKSVEVSSVDAYQGRQKDVILISTTRSNDYNNLGFVADWRRLNVALTRAKRLVVVVGHAPTLAADSGIWRPFLTWVKEKAFVTPSSRRILTRLNLLDKHDPQTLRSAALRRTPSLRAALTGR